MQFGVISTDRVPEGASVWAMPVCKARVGEYTLISDHIIMPIVMPYCKIIIIML